MATRDTTASRSSNASSTEGQARAQARVEQAAHIAGMATAFGRGAALGPQVLALQRAVLQGLVLSQQREADRLAARHGLDDPRPAQALDRAAGFEQLNTTLLQAGQVVGQMTETFQTDGLFHGYVHDADGAPAEGCTVRLEVRGGTRDQKPLQRGSAPTDATGYFRIDLQPGDNPSAPPRGTNPLAALLQRWTEGWADDGQGTTGDGQSGDVKDAADEREAAATAAAAAANANTNPNTNPSANPSATGDATSTDTSGGVVSSVQVIGAKGRVVYEDPNPPTFNPLGSEFRYYVLNDAGTEGGNSGEPKRRG